MSIRNNSFFNKWLRSIFTYINYQSIPPDLDIWDESIHKLSIDNSNSENLNSDNFNLQSEDILQLNHEDDLLKLIHKTLIEINEFEVEIDKAFDNLNRKLDNEYSQYE